jgi:hypothetical protein
MNIEAPVSTLVAISNNINDLHIYKYHGFSWDYTFQLNNAPSLPCKKYALSEIDLKELSTRFSTTDLFLWKSPIPKFHFPLETYAKDFFSLILHPFKAQIEPVCLLVEFFEFLSLSARGDFLHVNGKGCRYGHLHSKGSGTARL